MACCTWVGIDHDAGDQCYEDVWCIPDDRDKANCGASHDDWDFRFLEQREIQTTHGEYRR